MAIVRTDDKHYKNIANTLRSISGESDLYIPEQLPSAITKGINDAHSAGINVGYIEGYTIGYGVGEEQGYNIGFSEGYDEGETDGKQAESEEFWNSFFSNPLKNESFQYMFAGNGWNNDLFSKIIYPNEKIVITGAKGNNMLYMCNNVNWNSTKIDLSEFCKHFDFSQCTSAENMFQNAVAQNITVDFSNCTTLKNTFNGNNNGKLDNITLKVSNKCTTFQGAFDYQNQLTNIIFVEGSEITENINFNRSSLLTKESLMSIINALSVLPEGTTRTLTLHATSKGLLSDAEKAIITDEKGWTLA